MRKSEQPCHLMLTRPQETRAGRGLCLMQGDLLIAVNGAPFVAGEDALRQVFRQARGKPVLLGFQRGAQRFGVLALSMRLGEWRRQDLPDDVAAEAPAPTSPADLRALVNWTVFSARDGRYDLIPQRGSTTALFLPPVWLLQMHLWQEFAAFVVAMMVAISVVPWMGAVIFFGTGLALWQHGARLFHADRVVRGFHPKAVIAAETEAGAQAVYEALFPKGRFIYAPPVPQEKSA